MERDGAAPALVVQPAGTADVAAAVAFAREHGLPLSVRGGGHNIAGTAIADGGLTLDMSRLREVTVDPEPRTATVQPGCLLGDVDRATQRHGLATPLGFFSEVGVAGLTLGGGLGYLTRRFGWTVDNLLEVEIVTADGQIRTRQPRRERRPVLGGPRRRRQLRRRHPFTFRLHEVGPTVYGGLIAWPFERADEILRAYRTITSRGAPELTVWLILLRAPPAPFVPQSGTASGSAPWPSATAATCAGSTRRSRRSGARRPRVRPAPRSSPTRGAVVPRRHGAEGHALLLEDRVRRRAERRPALDLARPLRGVPHPGGADRLLHLGGALNERDADDGAVGNRDARFAIGVIGMWEPDEPGADTFPAWVRGAWERLRPFSTGGSYINFQTADEDEARVRASYGANFDRLSRSRNATTRTTCSAATATSSPRRRSRRQQPIGDEAAAARAGRQCEDRAAHVAGVRRERVVRGEPALQDGELPARVALIGQEEQAGVAGVGAVVVAVAAAQQRDAVVALGRGQAHVCVGGDRLALESERVVLAPGAERRAAAAMASDHALLLAAGSARHASRARRMRRTTR